MCGVFGIVGHPEASNLTYLGLHALQHRGQESAGIVSVNEGRLHAHRQMGLVADAFKEDVIKRLEGAAAIGHNRYSTQGQSHLKNAQPFVVEYSQGPIAISHNGNLVNGALLRVDVPQGEPIRVLNPTNPTLATGGFGGGSGLTTNRIAAIETADIVASNGVVHVIDNVLLP